eukprot:UN21329
MFFDRKNKSFIQLLKIIIFCDIKATSDFPCVTIPPKVMSRNICSLLILEIFKNYLSSLIKSKMVRIKGPIKILELSHPFKFYKYLQNFIGA